MQPFIYKIDYEVPKYKNHLKKLKNFNNIVKKTGIFETFKIKDDHSVIDLALKTCKRNLKYIKKCFHVPLKGPDFETLKILKLIAKNNIVLNTGHLSAIETLILVKYAKKLGVKKILVPANNFDIATISKLKQFKVVFEFSYFFISRAINIPLTHVDGEKHKITGTNENKLKELIKEAEPKNVILSSDSGVSVLPLPHLSFYKFIKIIINFGFSKKEINYMIKINSKNLFNL